MDNTYLMRIGTSRRKIYTIPPGTYNAVWSGYRVHLYDEKNIIFSHFDADKGMKGTLRVKVIIGDGPYAKICEIKTKPKKKNV